MRTRLSRRGAVQVEKRNVVDLRSGRRKDLEIYSAADVEPEPLPAQESGPERPRRAIVSINGKDVGEEIIMKRRSA
ncbi:MAG TPA: hypothetical protein VF135_07740 [Terriglobales bacterium]